MKNQEILWQRAKIATSILFVLIVSLLSAQEKNIREIKYELMSSILEENSNLGKILLYKNVLIFDWEKYLDKNYLDNNNSGINRFFEPVSTGITDCDITYMRESLAGTHSIKWRRKGIRKVKLINDNKKINFNKYSTFKYSLPLFNKGLTIALIVEEYVGGMENATLVIYICKLEDGSWKKIAFIQLWIS